MAKKCNFSLKNSDMRYSNVTDVAKLYIFHRGYTGHEHLPEFGLINMNGRMYDPLLGRFLSPDPFVQMPDFSQSYNRYSYCLNNPFKFSDPSGEKWWHWALGVALLGLPMLADPVSTTAGFATIGTATYTTILATASTTSFTWNSIDFTKSLGDGVFTSNWSNMGNWAKIEAARFTGIIGNFYFDKTATIGEWGLQLFNAFSFGGREMLQSEIGNVLTHSLNIGNKVNATGFYQGRLITRSNYTDAFGINGAISLGDYIVGGTNIALNPDDVGYSTDLFAHEFGHTYQSGIQGAMYLFRTGIASAIYHSRFTEQDANRRGFENLNITPTKLQYTQQTTSSYKWYEFAFAPMLWPFIWMWNY
ncbi:MAG: RHS repeat-associated core domain-containing protein [Dysgonamonadaceae bacterium]|jgi:RHS repeat-associated protein|nr:RHS repeat-associated core domain-containing protein [Dysgonamonadaceae bacterium]